MLKEIKCSLYFKYFEMGYLLLIIIEVQYCNVFWDTYTQTTKVTIAQS